MDVLEPFLLDVGDCTDYSPADLANQLQRVNKQREIVKQFLVGELPLEALLDCVADFGEDAAEYWDLVESIVNRTLIQETTIEGAQWLLNKIKAEK